MIVLVAEFYAKQGHEDLILSTLSDMVAYCNSDEEPGCIQYLVNQSMEDPRRFLLYEQYENEGALDAHRETAAFKEKVLGTIVPLLDKRERHLYRIVNAS